MGYINRTISYLKRNGIAATGYAVMERIDKEHMDPMQRKANEYGINANGVNFTSLAKEAFLEKKNGDIKFSILVPAYETKPIYLSQLIDSVLAQSYCNFELIIADASNTDVVKQTVEKYEDTRILYKKLEHNDGISQNTNEALKYSSGDYIGLLDHDDVLVSTALEEIYHVLKEKEYDLVYTDEDKISSDMQHLFEPNFKPDFNFDYLLCNNYICHFTVCKAQLMKQLGFRKEYDGAQDYDLILRVLIAIEKNKANEKLQESGKYDLGYLRSRIAHVPKILYHWRAHESSTADNPESKLYAYDAGKRALECFLKESNFSAKVEHSDHLGFYKVSYEPNLLSVRTDIKAVCFSNVKNGKVIHGPILDGVEQFRGMSSKYSGYLHRAHMPFDVDCAATDGVMIRREEIIKSDDAKYGDKIVYLPDRSWLL